MSNLVHNARIKLRARAFSNLGLLVLAICFAMPIARAGLSEETRMVIYGSGVLFWVVMQMGANWMLGKLKD
jgi:hypothetical protein